MKILIKKGLTISGKEIIPDEKYVSLEDYNKLRKALEDYNKLRKAIEASIHGLEYSAYNLTTLKTVDNLKHKHKYIMASTCSELTLLIEIRDLQQALSTTEEE